MVEGPVYSKSDHDLQQKSLAYSYRWVYCGFMGLLLPLLLQIRGNGFPGWGQLRVFRNRLILYFLSISQDAHEGCLRDFDSTANLRALGEGGRRGF